MQPKRHLHGGLPLLLSIAVDGVVSGALLGTGHAWYDAHLPGFAAGLLLGGAASVPLPPSCRRR